MYFILAMLVYHGNEFLVISILNIVKKYFLFSYSVYVESASLITRVCIDRLMIEWMNEWMNGCMDGWMDGWMDEGGG